MVEQSRSSSFQPVLYKKSEGTLDLNENGLKYLSSTRNDKETSDTDVSVPWQKILKHQVSPAGHPKSLMKIVLVEGAGKPMTFQFSNRPDLEKARKDISQRLQYFRSQHGSLSSPTSLSGTKRRHSDIKSPVSSTPVALVGRTTATSFGELDPTSLAVTRSSLLARNPTLRAQHQYLVEESKTVEEEDFWKTHQDLLEEEYARIAGITMAGTSSLLQSHLSTLTGRITLGVEEMRQIFILYPAVHKAYEEKVPLELSDEQFWRKYLESEYFHRDRGKIGAASRRKGDASSSGGNGVSGSSGKKAEEARAAAVGTDDLFSRYDQKLRETGQLEDGVFGSGTSGNGDVGSADGSRHKRWGTKLAVGQFDLASTFETERGKLLEGPRDHHPIDTEDDGKGAKVIQKYNRHWAMVLNPEEAVAGCNLMEVARKSVEDTIPNDNDAKAGGGIDDEMQRLVGFANSSNQEANHALGIGESDEYETLTLKNIELYHSGRTASYTAGAAGETEMDDIRKKSAIFSKTIVNKMTALASGQQSVVNSVEQTQLEDSFPPLALGRDLMKALTNKMVNDSKTDADTLEVIIALPEDFKKRLHLYFRRASELLRHFFGLKRLAECNPENRDYDQKLQKIVKGMEAIYRDMEQMRLEMNESGSLGVIMRKMVLQIMEQLNHAFKVSSSTGGGSSGGGFVTVEEF
ncbi:TFIIH p62 subunit [Nitzschia inconspicua]|uniref:TFIIH p62 subunit n=1 Tax=Nitzschia inconspicua TaxID=303405 RepID=A0A9K3LRA0_9STRA|nr:TFIIH p62 subunit [Nitzschia inconspicua]